MTAPIHGRLAAADLAATTDTSVYSVPAARKATVTISICNRNATAVTVRLAHIDGAIGDVADADYLEYGTSIPANGVLERTAMTMTATHTLLGYASGTGVSVVVFGIEEDA